MKKTIVLNMFFTLLLFSIISFTSFSGCSNNTIVDSDTGGQEYSISAYNYSDNHYFLDTAYKSNFKDYIVDGQLDDPGNLNRQVSTENLEVWVQTSNTNPERKLASLLIDLPALPPGSSSYDKSYYIPQQIPGKRYFGYFRKLSPSEYFVFYQAGFVGLKTTTSENDYAAITYKEVGSEKIYGTNSITYERDTLVLKMFKAGNINPYTDTLAWAMKMKNIYRLPASNIVQNGFQFKIYYVSPLTLNPSAYLPGSGPLMEVMRLGSYLPPDITIFNFIPGRTIIPESGDVIFPDLEPFNTTVLNATGGDSSLAFSDLYTKLKTEASISPKSNMYIFRGKVISPNSIAP